MGEEKAPNKLKERQTPSAASQNTKMKTMSKTKAAASGRISRPPSRLPAARLSTTTHTTQQQQSSPIRTHLANSIKAKADLAWFENFAGRTAMLGFFNALYFEGATNHGIFTDGGAHADEPTTSLHLSCVGSFGLFASVIYTRASVSLDRLPEDVKQTFATFGDSTKSQLNEVIDKYIDETETS